MAVPYRTFEYSNRDQEEASLAGAHNLEQMFALSQEQRRAEQEYFYRHLKEQLDWSEWLQKEAEHKAKAQMVMRYEAMMAQAIPQLYQINPSAPDADDQRAKWAARWPELLHTEQGIPNATAQFEQHARLGEGARKQREEIQARQDAAATAERNRREGAQEKEKDRLHELDLKRIEEEHKDTRHQAELKQNKLEFRSSAYQQTKSEAEALDNNIRATQALIDEQNAKENPDDETKKNIDQMIVQRDKDKARLAEREARIKGMETEFPELAGKPAKTEQTDQPKTEQVSPLGPGQSAPPSTTTGTTTSTGQTPENPNLGADPATMEDSSPSPASTATATPVSPASPAPVDTSESEPDTTAVTPAPGDKQARFNAEWDRLGKVMDDARSEQDTHFGRWKDVQDKVGQFGLGDLLTRGKEFDQLNRTSEDAWNQKKAAEKKYADAQKSRQALMQQLNPSASSATPIPTPSGSPSSGKPSLDSLFPASAQSQ